MVLKPSGVYEEGNWSITDGYLWLTVAYNVSISLSLSCLGVFLMATKRDLAPHRQALDSTYACTISNPIPSQACIQVPLRQGDRVLLVLARHRGFADGLFGPHSR